MSTNLQGWLAGLEDVVGVPPVPTALFLKAFTHKSYSHEQPEPRPPYNERLEFLGDAVVGLVVTSELWNRYPDWSEGALTRAKAALVNTEMLADRARALGLGRWLLLGKGEAQGGGRDRDSNLCDVFEALVGALYATYGLDVAAKFVQRQIGPLLEQQIWERSHVRDAKSDLQEKLQKVGTAVPKYVVTDVTGPDHRLTFSVDVLWQGRTIGSGRGGSKREAEQLAAQRALDSLSREGTGNETN